MIEALLRMPSWLRLNSAEAGIVAAHMQIRRVAAGEVLFQQDEAPTQADMMLLLDGEVSIERRAVREASALVVSIAGPGCLLGEMGLLDDSPRSASCVAATDAVLAVLPREALHRLVDDSPQVAAKLALGIASRLAERLRATSAKLSTLSQITAAMHPGIAPTPHRGTGSGA